MKPEEINIAIAKHRGYEFRHGSAQWGNDPDYKGRIGVYAPGGGFIGAYHKDWTHIPNYSGDLNAIAEAVNTLSEHQRKTWPHAISCAVGAPSDWWKSPSWLATVTEANALERCVAFLNVVGKWKEAE